jgi:hypothetical protein
MELKWKKSSASGSQGNCVELAEQGDLILIRESEHPETVIATTPEKLAAFIEGARRGDFDEFVS